MTDSNTWADLAACLAAVPRLERAACKGRAELFDLTPDSPAGAIDRAKGICDTVCRAQPACAAWVASTPPHLRPAGVVAGKLLGEPPAAPRRKRDPDVEDAWLRAYLGRRRGRAVVEQVLVAARAADIPGARLRAARRRIGARVLAGNAVIGTTWALHTEQLAVAS